MDRYGLDVWAGDTEIVSLPMTHGAQGTSVLLSEVSSLLLTLTDVGSNTIVNSRNGQNGLNANGVAVTDGKVVWSIQPADTALVNASVIGEIHLATLVMTLTDGQVRTATISIRTRKRP